KIKNNKLIKVSGKNIKSDISLLYYIIPGAILFSIFCSNLYITFLFQSMFFSIVIYIILIFSIILIVYGIFFRDS
ncbi:MAG: hypothetical protein ACTSRP_05160, partial [Candidatus Helarchaeota archaeon]